MSDNVDIEDVRRTLEGANLYEEGMSLENMKNLYSFISNSEITNDDDTFHNKTENFNNNNFNNVNKSMKPQQAGKRRVEAELKVHANTIPKNQTLSKQSPLEKPQDSTKTLKLKAAESSNTTNESLKYLDTFYFQEEFETLAISERIAAVAKYHLKLSTNLYNHQRQSLNFAEWGKPIAPSARFNGHLEKNVDNSEDGESEDESTNNNNSINENLKDTPEVHKNDCNYVNNNETITEDYVLKSGRSTKRKLYMNFDDDEELEIETKKSKPILRRTPRSSKNNESKESLKNTPTRTPKTRSRSELLFDKLTEKEKSMKKAQIEQEKFEATLQQDSDDDYDLKITSYQIRKDDDFVDPKAGTSVKRRVIPPVHGRKGYKRKQTIETVPKAVPNTPKDDLESIEIDNSPTSSPSKNETTCPICSKSFSTKDVATHASSCGISKSIQIENSWDLGLITCEICDKVFEVNTDFEVHVTECIKKQRR